MVFFLCFLRFLRFLRFLALLSGGSSHAPTGPISPKPQMPRMDRPWAMPRRDGRVELVASVRTQRSKSAASMAGPFAHLDNENSRFQDEHNASGLGTAMRKPWSATGSNSAGASLQPWPSYRSASCHASRMVPRTSRWRLASIAGDSFYGDTPRDVAESSFRVTRFGRCIALE